MTTYVVTDYDGRNYITAGKRYEVISKNDRGFRFRDDTGDDIFSCWTGSYLIGKGDWTVIEEPDPPKTWGEMTDAEKGALLLARHEGKKIQVLLPTGSWVGASPIWNNKFAYRIKPELVVGEMVLSGWHRQDAMKAAFGPYSVDDTHTITLPTLDGQLVTGEFANEDGMKVVIEEKQK